MSAIRGNKSELAKQDKILADTIRGRAVARGITLERLAHRIGMSHDTLTRRPKQPKDFTLSELRKLAGEMGWGADSIYKLLF